MPTLMYSTKDNDLTADQILQTSVLADEGETSAHGFKQNKDQLTILTCANTDGIHTFTLLVVGEI